MRVGAKIMSNPVFDQELMLRTIGDGPFGTPPGPVSLGPLDIRQTPVSGKAVRLSFEPVAAPVTGISVTLTFPATRIGQADYVVEKTNLDVPLAGRTMIVPFSGQRATIEVEIGWAGNILGAADIGVVLKAHDDFSREAGPFG